MRQDISPQARGRWFVTAQFGLIALALVPVGPVLHGPDWLDTASTVAGVVGWFLGAVALVALGRATRVSPVPAAAAELRTGGVYGVVRHPMYAAVLLLVGGVALGSGRVVAGVSWALLAVVLHHKAAFEDRLLAARFGAAHEVYRTDVPALVPRLRPRRTAAGGGAGDRGAGGAA